MTMLRSVARPMLASVFVAGGINSLRNTSDIAQRAKPIADAIVPKLQRIAPQLPIPQDPATLVRINGATRLVGGLMLATGHLPRTTSLVLAASLVPNTAVEHQFWNASDPDERSNQRQHFVKNVALIGGLLMASLDPDPHKKVLFKRAKDQVVAAKDTVVDYAT